MLDIKFIKENKEIVADAIKNKNRKISVDEIIAAYDARTALRTELDLLNQKRNEASKARDVEVGQKLKKEAEELEQKFKEADKKYFSLVLQVPNVPSPDTPIGVDDKANQVLRVVGEKTTFDFEPKSHDELGKTLDLIDTETAATVSGSRFAYIKGDLALMQFALIQLCLSVLTSEETLKKIASSVGLNLSVKPFIPVIPPVFVKPAVQNRMARFLSPEEHYMFPNDDLMLVGSAEHTLGPMHMDHIFEEKDLPLRYVGYSTAFRREAGTYGKDTKGILRQHQFDKLEMEVFSLPEHSIEEQNFLVAIQEHILELLKLPYQVVIISTGDMGFPDYRQLDIETWLPSEGKYRETHSADLTGSFQSRRLMARVKRANGTIDFVHMNDATVVAVGRVLIAILENYQKKDGTVEIPKLLRPYMNNKKAIEGSHV